MLSGNGHYPGLPVQLRRPARAVPGDSLTECRSIDGANSLAEIALFRLQLPTEGLGVLQRPAPFDQPEPALFSLLGNDLFGGDGRQTFAALPDLRGRVPIHAGQGPSLNSYVLGPSRWGGGRHPEYHPVGGTRPLGDVQQRVGKQPQSRGRSVGGLDRGRQRLFHGDRARRDGGELHPIRGRQPAALEHHALSRRGASLHCPAGDLPRGN